MFLEPNTVKTFKRSEVLDALFSQPKEKPVPQQSLQVFFAGRHLFIYFHNAERLKRYELVLDQSFNNNTISLQ